MAAVSLLSPGCRDEPAPASASLDSEELARDPIFPQIRIFPPELTEQCDVYVEGDRRVARALLGTKPGKVIELKVLDGRHLRIICPEDALELEDVLLLAELEADDGVHRLANVVHWTIDLDPAPSLDVVHLDQAKRGLPELLDEDLVRVKEEWRDMIDWSDPGGAPRVEAPQDGTPQDGVAPAPAPPAKVRVEILSRRLGWAELELVSETNGRKRRLTLNPRASRALPPDRYRVKVRYPEGATEWRDAGELIIEPGWSRLVYEMEERPKLHAHLYDAE